jgi:hypothetical protein
MLEMFSLHNISKLKNLWRVITMANTKTINQRVLEAFEKGQELTSAQIKSRFGAGNPQSVVQSLRFAGYPIYLNSKKTGASKYRLGTASRRIISAGYKAMASGIDA